MALGGLPSQVHVFDSYQAESVTPPPSPPPPPVPSVTVQVTLDAVGDAIGASLVGLRWAFFDNPLWPDCLVGGAVDQGIVGSTSGSAYATFEVPHTTLASGEVGLLMFTDSDGTLTQSPPPRSFFAPVALD